MDGDRDCVLLTGLPNVLARRVLGELVAGGARVRAIVKRDDWVEAEAALALLAPGSVELIEGDPSSMDLGLSGREFNALAAELDRIHHVAITTGTTVDAKSAEATNVVGAREVLELAEACSHLRALVFHSSVTVSGGREGLVREDDPLPRDGFRNVVEETLARAERMMFDAMSSVPVVIVRSGMMVGDSVTGEVDRLDGFYLLVLLIMTSPRELALPMPSRGDAPLHLVPVDFVAKAACQIGRDPRSVGKVFHLVDRRPLSSKQALDVVAQAAGRRMGRGFIPANVTKALLSAPGLDRFARSPRTLLDALATRVSYGTDNADAILAGTHIECPSFESYADVLIDYVRRRLDARKERRAATSDYDPLV